MSWAGPIANPATARGVSWLEGRVWEPLITTPLTAWRDRVVVALPRYPGHDLFGFRWPARDGEAAGGGLAWRLRNNKAGFEAGCTLTLITYNSCCTSYIIRKAEDDTNKHQQQLLHTVGRSQGQRCHRTQWR